MKNMLEEKLFVEMGQEYACPNFCHLYWEVSSFSSGIRVAHEAHVDLRPDPDIESGSSGVVGVLRITWFRHFVLRLELRLED